MGETLRFVKSSSSGSQKALNGMGTINGLRGFMMSPLLLPFNPGTGDLPRFAPWAMIVGFFIVGNRPRR